jgi:myo-inositol 2-dehydrogenase/D-chiro-inositol 1-dehydrogenase
MMGAIGKDRCSVYPVPCQSYVESPANLVSPDMEPQLRDWYHYAGLSGNDIVEQAVHSIDKMCWSLNRELPVRFLRWAGNKSATARIMDPFTIMAVSAMTMPMVVKGFHCFRQKANCFNENKDYSGNSKIAGFNRKDIIRGENEWVYKGEFNNMYQTEHDELFASQDGVER